VTQAVHIPGLASLEESRAAHAWRRLEPYESTNTSTLATVVTRRILWADPSVSVIGGLAVTESTLYMAAVQDASPVILKMSLVTEEEDDDDDDDDDDDEDSKDSKANENETAATRKSTVVAQASHNLSRHGNVPGAMVVTEAGDLIVAVDSKVVVCRANQATVTTTVAAGSDDCDVLLHLPEVPTSLVLGDDKYLYVTSQTKLYRHFLNSQPYKLPTNLLPRPPQVLTKKDATTN
jgi:hypothetical protein